MKLKYMVFSAMLLNSVTAYADFGTVSCAPAQGADFVPNFGQVVVGEDSTSRYIQQWVYWQNDDRLKWFKNNADSTFEPDAFFDNASYQPYGWAPSGYWASDMPEPYQDTNTLGDNWREKAVTVGSSNAAALQSGVIYYMVTRMVSGAGNSSEVKLSAQRGRLVPSWTPPSQATNYSFGCDSHSASEVNNVKVIPWYTFVAPGCHKYWYFYQQGGTYYTLNQSC